MDNEVSVYFQLNENVTMTDVKTLQLAACAEAIYNPPRNSHDRTRIKETNTKRRPEPTRLRPPTPNKHPTQLPPPGPKPITFPNSATTPANPRPNPQAAIDQSQADNPPIATIHQ